MKLGRMNRYTYATNTVFVKIGQFAIPFVAVLAPNELPDFAVGVFGGSAVLVWVALEIWLWASTIRRLHDFSASGWWSIPLHGMALAGTYMMVGRGQIGGALLHLILVALWFFGGVPTENTFGPRPPRIPAKKILIDLTIYVVALVVAAIIGWQTLHSTTGVSRRAGRSSVVLPGRAPNRPQPKPIEGPAVAPLPLPE